MSHPPYTDAEAAEARTWVCKYGPPNSWTAGNGTAARMIGRLLKERERLMAKWFAVTDCLPPKGERVMFLVSRAGYRAVWAGEYDAFSGLWRYTEEAGWAAAFVTHWTHLPGLPACHP